MVTCVRDTCACTISGYAPHLRAWANHYRLHTFYMQLLRWFFPCGTMFLWCFTQVTWHAQNCPICGNKTDLISAPHFHLKGRGGGVHDNIWLDDDLILLNGSILVVHLRSYNGHNLKSHFENLKRQFMIRHTRSRDALFLCDHVVQTCHSDEDLTIVT